MSDTLRGLLRSLAIDSGARVVRLWTSDPQALPARVPAINGRRVVRRHEQRSRDQVTDRVIIHSARPMSIQANSQAADRPEPLLPKFQAPEHPLVLAPAGTVSEAPQPPAASLAPRKADPAEPAVVAVAPAGPSRTGSEASLSQAEATLSAADPTAGRRSPEPADARIKRLTDGTSESPWVMMTSEGSPAVLFAQGNVARMTEFSTAALNSPSDRQSTSTHASQMDTPPARGWISGRIPQGTQVRVKGVSRVDYYPAPSEARESGQYFVARNVEPGPAVVQLVESEGGAFLSSAGLPILPGVATQVDFRNSSSVRVRGSLWQSESASPKGVAHAEVKLVGFPDHVAITASDGTFDLGEVRVPRGIALFVEARLAGGFTHRYSIPEGRLSRGLNLFLFSDERVHQWVGALEGGLSAESGLLVASVPAERARNGRPVVKTLAGSSGFRAETYWLTDADGLQEPVVPPEVSGGFVRWVGVEVTSRSVIAGLQSPRGRWLQAEWVPASPGVISVLSPSE